MAKEKEIKTNAMRILDRAKIKYEVIQYEGGEFIDGLHTAKKTGAPVDQSFKTLVVQGKSRQYYVFVLPIAKEIDLKKAARCVQEKAVEMIHVKDITATTGYVRGGCSPIGMKKQFPTVIADLAEQYDKIYISGGRIGTTLVLSPDDLKKISRRSTVTLSNKIENLSFPGEKMINKNFRPDFFIFYYEIKFQKPFTRY